MVKVAIPSADKAESAMQLTSSSGGSGIFSLFEPCHPGDVVDGVETVNHEVSGKALLAGQRLASEGCLDLLSRLTSCNFDGVSNLWGWTNLHTTSYNESYTPKNAASHCTRAAVVVVKAIGTARWVDTNRYITNLVPLLDRNQNLKIVDVVRDPRSIYASWKSTDPFPQILADRVEPLHSELCDTFKRNSAVDDPRVYRLVFEDLVSSPLRVMKDVYKFLGLTFERPQKDWMDRTFNSADCSGPMHVKYADCHTNSETEVARWREVLTQEEIDMFTSSTICQQVFKAYGYPFS